MSAARWIVLANAQREWLSRPELQYTFGDFQSFWDNVTAELQTAIRQGVAWWADFERGNRAKLLEANARLEHARFPLTSSPLGWPTADRSGDKLTLWLYGPLRALNAPGSCDLADALREHVDATAIIVRIASAGGHVLTARELASAIGRHRGKSIAIVDHNCWSSAALVAGACDRVYIRRGASMMVHKTSTCAAGDVDALLSAASGLEHCDEIFVRELSRARRISSSLVQRLVNEARFLDAAEAVLHGLADDVLPDIPPHPSPVPAGESPHQRTLENDHVSETKA